MKKIIVGLILIFASLNAFSQGQVALHTSGTSKIYFGYSAFDNAYTNAKSGDTIYVSGGTYAVGNVIAKKLVMIGAGYHPDSTKATGISKLDGTVNFSSGGSGSWLEGFYVNGNVSPYHYDSANNLRIHRCYLTSNIVTTSYYGRMNENITVTECNFNGVYSGNSVRNLYVGNCIVRSGFESINQPSVIENNYIYSTGYNWIFNSVQWSLIRNNIINNSFYPSYATTSTINCKFRNNLWTNAIGGSYYSNDTANDKVGFLIDSLFKNVPGLGFEWSYNFHLKPGPATKYKGTDGSEVCLYGGSISPFKEGAVPRNPHIQSVLIDEKTDNTGKLKVNIKVQAQKR